MTIQEYLLTVADAVAQRSKCRRKVGCVIADSQGRILSTGYNGLPRGMTNCTIDTCTNLANAPGECLAIHAEQNAILFCTQPERAHYIAVTRLPCTNCALLLIQLQGVELIYRYENSYPKALELLERGYVITKI